jgi:hypothetical protein
MILDGHKKVVPPKKIKKDYLLPFRVNCTAVQHNLTMQKVLSESPLLWVSYTISKGCEESVVVVNCIVNPAAAVVSRR